MSTRAAPLVRGAAVLAYPFVLGAASASVVTLVENGVPYAVSTLVTIAGGAVAVAGLERLLPFRRSWGHDQGDVRADTMHVLANLAVSHASMGVYAVLASVRHFAPAHALLVWPVSSPLAVQLLLALVVVDLGFYAVHRASHGLPLLWRLHAIHHSSRRLYFANGHRRHLLHEVIEGTPGLLVLLLLGAPVAAYASAVAIMTVHVFFQHANVAFRFGPLQTIFSVGEAHRWHHQRKWQDVQGNFGAMLAVWDHLFGTALRTSGAAPDEVGLDEAPDLPSDWSGQQVWPFLRGGQGREPSDPDAPAERPPVRR